MTNREIALTRLDLSKLDQNGRYVDLNKSIMKTLAYEDILFLRRFYNDRNIARNYEFAHIQPIDPNRLNAKKNPGPKKKQTQIRRKNTKKYALTRDNKYTNKKHKGIKKSGFKMVVAAGLIILSFSTVKNFANTEIIGFPINTVESYSENQTIDVAGVNDYEEIATAEVEPEAPVIDERRELINELANIFQVDADKAYETISALTDNFESDDFLNKLTIENVSCKGSGQIYADSEEELFLYTMRILKQAPGRFGISADNIKINNDYESSTNYREIISKYSNILGVDPCLVHAIITAETGWESEMFNNLNNPAGIKTNSGNWWNFDTKEEGIIELMLEILKYQRAGAYTIEEISEIHCPLSDPGDVNNINKNWVSNVKDAYNEAQGLYANEISQQQKR